MGNGMERVKGFSLIELMITVAIIGIISAVAYPSYTAYVKDARRTIAQNELRLFAQEIESYKSKMWTYTGVNAGGSGYSSPNTAVIDVPSQVPRDSAVKYYQLTVSVVPAGTGFTVRATPISGSIMDGDECLTYQLTNEGEQQIVGGMPSPALVARCWD